MKRLIFLGLILVSTVANADVAATVDHAGISDLMVYAANPSAQGNSSEFNTTLQLLINRQVLANVAQNNHLIDEKKLSASLDVEKQATLAKVAAQKYLSEHPITKTQIESAYTKYKKNLPSKEIRYRFIVVDSYKKAEDIITDLKDGQPFSNLAATYSAANNAGLGGESGWTASTRLPAPFMSYLHQMKPMQIAGPIAIPEGYAIIQLLGERATPIPSTEQVSDTLRQQLEDEEIKAYVEKLRSSAKVRITANGEK